jgi:hypothetical protein
MPFHYERQCSCGWFVDVDSMEEAERLDQLHQQRHRDDPAGDYRNWPQPGTDQR